MQEEYALVLAQLKLAGQVDDFHLHGMSFYFAFTPTKKDMCGTERGWLTNRIKYDAGRGCRFTGTEGIV
jgi:hypothetical protein